MKSDWIATLAHNVRNDDIAISSATTTTLLSVPANKRFMIYSVVILVGAGGTNALTFNSGSTALTGAMTLAASTRYDFSHELVPIFSGVALDDDFTLTTSTNITINGTIVYVLVDQ